MDVNRELFWEDIDSDEVHIRDKNQFALKSEYTPLSTAKSRYIQEFYFFIPNSLQINSKTYSDADFYIDQTTLIRYKTPQFTFHELFDIHEQQSPLMRVISLCKDQDTEQNRSHLSTELKLLANVVRSTIRRLTKEIILLLQRPDSIQSVTKSTQELCENIIFMRDLYTQAQKNFLKNWKDPLFYRQMLYIDEFFSDIILHYLTDILKNIRLVADERLASADAAITQLLIDEKYQTETLTSKGSALQDKTNTIEGELTLYRANLLNKFVLEPLMLSTNRFSFEDRYKHYIGAASAGVAIVFYLILFAWLGRNFVLNSAPFIVLAAFFYVVKDRIKEWIKSVSYQRASVLFPDYETVIKSIDSKQIIGVLKEDFSFVEPNKLPQDIRVLRNAEFHAVLETFQRPESVLYYKREVRLNPLVHREGKRRTDLNIIFRFNIHNLLRQASEPIESHLTLDPQTKLLVTIRLPKVYHFNMIIKTTTATSDGHQEVKLEKLRLIVDKNGIKRIELV